MTSAAKSESCEDCGLRVPAHDIIHLSGLPAASRRVCTRCFNTRVAGIDFEHPSFEPILLADGSGIRHEFHFTTRHGGSHLAVEAFEIENGCPGGYQFQVLGDPDEEPIEIFQRLFERMRRALARRHIEPTEHGPQVAKSREGWIVRGHVEWDEEQQGRLPLIVVDGKGYSWDEIGRMLVSFEGFQVKMEIYDKSEER